MNQTLRERIDKSIVGKIIKGKVNIGLGVPIQNKIKFTNELADELYKSVTRKFFEKERHYFLNSSLVMSLLT